MYYPSVEHAFVLGLYLERVMIMEERLSYEEFKDWVGKYNFRNLKDNYKFEYIVSKIDDFIDQKEIKVFYPKTLLVEEMETELLFFTDDKVYKVTGKDHQEGNAKFDVYLLENIIDYNFEFEEESGENIKLNIRFNTDIHIELSALDDTTSGWRNTYLSKVNEIIKLL